MPPIVRGLLILINKLHIVVGLFTRGMGRIDNVDADLLIHLGRRITLAVPYDTGHSLNPKLYWVAKELLVVLVAVIK